MVRPVGAARRVVTPRENASAVPLIRCESVSKRFGRTVAIDDLSLDIYAGEFFCLLGPSGCGKTTLMRMIAGFEEPSAGRISLDGRDLAGVPPYRRPVNMMFQSYALFPHMSVERNIAFGLRQDRLPKAEIAIRVDEMLRLVQMAPFARRSPDQLSGGQRQRVALARALAKRPKVLLLDEPLAALDRKLREETQFELMEIQARLGTTFVVVTHDQDEAMSMADRIAVMDRGRVAQVGDPVTLYEEPNSRFVAGFLGDVNLFEGFVEGQDGGRWRIAVPPLGTRLTVDAPAADLQVGAAIAIAVRPEKMTITQGDQEGRPNVLAGEVSDAGYLGHWTVYRVRLDAGPVVRVSRANAPRSAEDALARGEPVHVTFAPEAAVILAG